MWPGRPQEGWLINFQGLAVAVATRQRKAMAEQLLRSEAVILKSSSGEEVAEQAGTTRSPQELTPCSFLLAFQTSHRASSLGREGSSCDPLNLIEEVSKAQRTEGRTQAPHPEEAVHMQMNTHQCPRDCRSSWPFPGVNSFPWCNDAHF